MADELWSTLLRFHREVALPEIDRVVGAPLRDDLATFRRDMQSNFDALLSAFDRLHDFHHRGHKGH
jgi:hypothetical protein